MINHHRTWRHNKWFKICKWIVNIEKCLFIINFSHSLYYTEKDKPLFLSLIVVINWEWLWPKKNFVLFWIIQVHVCVFQSVMSVLWGHLWCFVLWCQQNMLFTLYQFSSVTQSCLTPWNPMNRSTPGLPVHHQLPEFTQTHVHQVSDAIQPSHPLSSPSPLAPNPSQHQSLFQWVNFSHEVAKVLEFQL